MINSMYSHMLDETSRSLNMERKRLQSDTRRLAEYWEIALENGRIKDVNTAILFLDTGVHGYLKAKDIDLGNKRRLKKDQTILARMILLISMYILEQPKSDFPKINELTPMFEMELHHAAQRNDIMAQVENILRQKSENNS
jgi:hypothetical protein